MGNLTLKLTFAVQALMLSSFMIVASAQDETSETVTLETPRDKLSYVLGLEVGQSLKQMKDELDLAIFIKAVEDALEDQDKLLSAEEALFEPVPGQVGDHVEHHHGSARHEELVASKKEAEQSAAKRALDRRAT